MTFSANKLMLFSVYSRGALPTEKFAISTPNPTFRAYSSSRWRTVSGLPTMTYPASSTSFHVDRLEGRDSSRRYIIPITLETDV
jgi:hypothetical protein